MRRTAAWVTTPTGTPPARGTAAADGAVFQRVTTTQSNALNQMVTVNRPQSVELSGIASASAEVELRVARQPSAQNPDPAAVVAARPPNRNRPPASGEPDGWSHWLSDTGTASFGQWPKVKVKATTQSETLGTLVDEVEGRGWIKPDESPVYDPRGNLIQDGGWTYEWDARNRLLAAEMRPQHLPDDLPQIRVEHRYDWMSRRVVTITKEKRVDTQTGARESVWRVLEHRHFWYDGWHLMAETVQGGAPGSVAAVTQRYIWGLDLAGDWERGMGQTRPQGSSTRTGGVGALLGVMTSAGKTYSVCNDANGNVMGFIDLGTATLTARFDYDAFGNPITNWTAPNHPAPETITRVRFSSKHQDPHTGWLYYGYRWYDAENGRWPSRDPIGEEGGLNLYGMVGNDPVNDVDINGEIGLAGAIFGAVFEIGIQVTVNLAKGDDWYNIDVKDVLISAAVGAVAPGALASAKKAKNAWEGAKNLNQTVTKIATSRGKRVKGGGSDSLAEVRKLHNRIKGKIREHNRIVKDAVETVSVQVAWQTSKALAKKLADEIEEIVRKNPCLPEATLQIEQKDRFILLYDNEGKLVPAILSPRPF
jgi:RHS repeat-associated protein